MRLELVAHEHAQRNHSEDDPRSKGADCERLEPLTRVLKELRKAKLLMWELSRRLPRALASVATRSA